MELFKCCALRILLKSIWSCSRWRGGSADEIKLPFVKSCSHFDTSLRWNFSEVSASVLTPTLKNSILRSWPGESNFSHFLSIDLNLDCFSTLQNITTGRILNRRRTLWMWDMSQAERFSHPPKLATITLPWKSNTIRFEGKKLASLKLNAFTQIVWYIHLLPFIKQCTLSLSLMFHIIVWSDLSHCVTTVWVYLLTIEDNSAGSISQYSIWRKSKKQSEKNTGWLSIKDSLYLPLMIAVQSPDLQKWMFFIGDVWENFERSAFGDQHHWDWDLHYITLIFSFKGISQHKSCIVMERFKNYFFFLKRGQKRLKNM